MPYRYQRVETSTREPLHTKRLAVRVRRLCRRRGWGQLALARASGVGLRSIQLVLAGHNDLRLSNAVRLSKALGVSLDYLAGLSDDQRLHTGVLLIERDEDAD